MEKSLEERLTKFQDEFLKVFLETYRNRSTKSSSKQKLSLEEFLEEPLAKSVVEFLEKSL